MAAIAACEGSYAPVGQLAGGGGCSPGGGGGAVAGGGGA